MSLPPFDFFLRPVLLAIQDGNIHKTSEIYELVKQEVELDEESYQEMIPSGGSRFKDRISWCITYLKKGELIQSPKFGYQQITDIGMDEIRTGEKNPRLNYFIKKYPSIGQFYQGESKNNIAEEKIECAITPVEAIDQAMSDLNRSLSDELLNEIYKERDWSYFEKLVLKVMQSLGYGIDDYSLILTGKPGDEGIDGEINEDRLGFDKIYIQAKHYKPDSFINDQIVRNFIGSMSVKGVSKGILITTSSFTEKAKKMAATSTNIRVKLIDGQELVKLMIENNIGVSVSRTYEIKRIDMDFFDGI